MKRNYYFISFSFFFLLIEEKRYFHVGFSQPKKFYLYKKYTHLYLGLMKKKKLLLIENHMLIWFWFLIFISWGMLCTPIYSKLGGQTTFFLPLSLSLCKFDSKMNIYRIIQRKANTEWKNWAHGIGIKSLSRTWVEQAYLLSSIELSTTRIPTFLQSNAYIENKHDWIDFFCSFIIIPQHFSARCIFPEMYIPWCSSLDCHLGCTGIPF